MKKFLLLLLFISSVLVATQIRAMPAIVESNTDFDFYQLSEHEYAVDLKTSISSYLDNYFLFYQLIVGLSEKDTVHIYLRNLGGSVISGILVVNGIKDSKATVVARVVGFTASMGALIACSADKIVVSPLGSLMFHAASGSLEGKLSDSQALIDYINSAGKEMMQGCVAKGLLTDQQVNDILKGQDVYLTNIAGTYK